MKRGIAALATGLGLAAAAALWVPATPALAEQQEASGICLPVLMTCPSPSPSAPAPAPSQGQGQSGGGPLGSVLDPVLGPLLGGAVAPIIPVAPQVPLTLDESAPILTQPAAQMGAEGLEIGGLQSVDVVLVRTITGQQIPVIRILADSIAVNGFTLDVRSSADSAAAVDTSSRMELRGHVRVYLQSLTATLPGGGGISLLAPIPVPGDELPPTLLRATFGLVGATGDASTWTHTDLRMHETD